MILVTKPLPANILLRREVWAGAQIYDKINFAYNS